MHRRTTWARLFLAPAVIALILLLSASLGVAHKPRPPAPDHPLSSVELVMVAYDRGELTYDEMLVQRHYALFAPAKLDPRFRSPVKNLGATRCATAHLLDVFNAWRRGRLDARGRQVFQGLFVRPTEGASSRRPTQPGTGDVFSYSTGDTVYSWDTPSGLFRIHWVQTAPHAPDLTDADSSGVPDYIEEIGGYLDYSANVEFNVLGYLPPPSDATLPSAMDNGGDGRLDIYIGDLLGTSGGILGYVMPEWDGPDPVRDDAICYMVLDDDYDIQGDLGVSPAPWTDQIYARTTCAHELHHTSQMNYDGLGGDSWFFEQTSTYMEEKVYPDDNQYVAFIGSFFFLSEWGLDYFDYPGAVWPVFIDEHLGPSAMREIWENLSNNGVTNPTAVESWVTTFGNRGTSLADEYTEFMEWNYVCGQNDDGNHYTDGPLYGPPMFGPYGPDGSSVYIDPEHVHPLNPTTPDASSPLTIPYPPDHLGTNYVQFDLDGSTGGVTIDFKGNAGPTWAVRVIKVTRPPAVTYTTQDMVLTGGREGFLDILDTDQYDRLIMCVNVVSTFGDAYGYLYRAHFDPGMVSGQPPRPATGVTAEDAPDDDGGAIRVSWALSKDDGRGANDVTGYDVLRSEDGPTTGFNPVVTMLPSGTFEYIDTPTPEDCTDYWYMVRVHDGDGFAVDSTVPPPAQSRDDTAPDALEHLAAVDRPSDLGHAVIIDWGPVGDPGDPDYQPGYSPPADFGSYRIYRSDAPFTDVTGMTPIGTVNAPFVVQFVDDDPTLENGTTYYYAVTCTDNACPEPNEDQTDLVIASAVPAHDFDATYPAGLSLIGLPANPFDSSPQAVFGTPDGAGGYTLPNGFNLMRYEPGLTPTWHVFRTVLGYPGDPNDPYLNVVPGRGFWLVLGEPKTFGVDGRAVPAGDFTMPLPKGWVQLGNPFDRAMEFVAATVSVAGTDYTLDEANAAGVATNYAWIYNSAANTYQLVHSSIPFAVRYVPAYLGLWYRTMTECTIALPRPSGASAESLDELKPNGRQSPPTADDWEIQIVARIAGRKLADTCNAVGVRSDAERVSGIVSPPALAGYVDAYVVGDDKVTRYATHYLPALSGRHAWDLVVETDLPDADVVVEFPDLTEVPRDCRAYLVDLDAGRRRSLRTTNAYVYNSGPGGARHFRLEVSRGQDAALTVTGLSAVPNRGRGAQISFNLSVPASVRADIVNVAGRVIATLSSQGTVAAGRAYLTWDGTNKAGAIVPPGTYLVRVTAADEDGQRARGVTALLLGR